MENENKLFLLILLNIKKFFLFTFKKCNILK